MSSERRTRRRERSNMQWASKKWGVGEGLQKTMVKGRRKEMVKGGRGRC